MTSETTILRLPEVLKLSGDARSTLYLRIKQGLWIKPISLGGRCVGWCESEVIALNKARISGLSDDNIRLLIKKLEAERKI